MLIICKSLSEIFEIKMSFVKRKLRDLLFKKEYGELMYLLEKTNNEFNKLYLESTSTIQFHNMMRELLRKDNGVNCVNGIVAIVNTDNGPIAVIKSEYDDRLNFYLHGAPFNYAICNTPCIFATKHSDLKGQNTYIKIDDISTNGYINQGYGSILMPYLIQQCKDLNITEIKGELSPVDRGHFGRSEHFYQKHGFEVAFNKERTRGIISLKLNA